MTILSIVQVMRRKIIELIVMDMIIFVYLLSMLTTLYDVMTDFLCSLHCIQYRIHLISFCVVHLDLIEFFFGS